MSKFKSLIESTKVDQALKAHNCQHTSKHRLEKGDVRMGVRVGRSVEYFCLDCSLRMIEADLARLTNLKRVLLEASGRAPE